MQCSKPMRAFIYSGVALCGAGLLLVPFTSAGVSKAPDPEIVASQDAKGANFKIISEMSGIAVAGFRDDSGHPLLWTQNEKTSRIPLITTAPASTLYVGAVTMPGKKTRDAEDIAVVHDQGKGTIYLADTGSNRKDMPACIRYARDKSKPSQCHITEYVTEHINKKLAGDVAGSEAACLARGEDWLWQFETDHLEPGVHPSIRRLAEPGYADVMRGTLAKDTAVIEFDYPALCDGKPCRGKADHGMSDTAHAYNIEALAVVVEPDHSHTAYLFSKTPHSLSNALSKQHAAAAACSFDDEGLSDVFRIPHIDALSSGQLHQAEYVATLDFSSSGHLVETDDTKWRVTAANFLKLSDSQGLLLLRTNLHAFKWAVALSGGAGTGAAPHFDVAGALQHVSPLPAAVPNHHRKQGVGKKNEEAATQLDESTIYYAGECKRLPKCAVAMVRDDHPYLAGDVDGNGRIDAADLIALRKFLSRDAALYCKAAADVNGDGNISEADYDYLQRFLAGRGPAPRQSTSPTGAAVGLSCGYYNPEHRQLRDQAKPLLAKSSTIESR